MLLQWFGSAQFTDEETEAPAKGGVGASGPVSDQHLLRGLWTRIRSASPPPRRPWYSWRPPLRTRPAGGGRSGGSWMHAEASAASAWVAIWNSGASSRSSWASPCTRSWPSSCWTGPEPVAPKGLQYLVLLSHAHSRECSLVPGLRGPGGQDGGLVWECSAGHTFSWGPSSGPKSPEEPNLTPLPSTDERSWCPEAKSGQEPAGLESNCDERAQEARMPRGAGPPPETFPSLGEDGEEEEEDEEEMLSDASPWTYSSSPDDSEPDVPKPPPSPVTHALKDGEIAPAPAAVPAPLASPSSSASSLGSGAPRPVEVRIQPELRGTPQADQQTEPLASPGNQAQSALASAWDEDTAQIGPKRIRKAAKRELLPCDFPGCGRIFSNRQYLNHHKKYQHIHQKSFSCPEPACGKSFNFKKHLKEHVKLHSDTRDYICEFCARSFRTSSNLVIHRRIHTGEKPLQCEICGFTCRQKASLNWHRRKHAETVAALRFPCEFCGKRFEKPDSVAAHRSKSHPALLLAPQELSGPVESCSSILASASLGASEGSRSTLAPQAPILLP
ncbi:zinc finger protein 692 isoform X3 [Bos taurus]|uniref:zinc finger protein 692 isoform X3 n=1 Tax=Bos taurus TaxID=9913 RepID=UPI000D53752C|nr:zinc finger protein 692 isoform X3 [Bos taurus]